MKSKLNLDKLLGDVARAPKQKHAAKVAKIAKHKKQTAKIAEKRAALKVTKGAVDSADSVSVDSASADIAEKTIEEVAHLIHEQGHHAQIDALIKTYGRVDSLRENISGNVTDVADPERLEKLLARYLDERIEPALVQALEALFGCPIVDDSETDPEVDSEADTEPHIEPAPPAPTAPEPAQEEYPAPTEPSLAPVWTPQTGVYAGAPQPTYAPVQPAVAQPVTLPGSWPQPR